MGSDSDLETMAPAAEALGELGIPHEVRVVSAHRTPHDMLAYGAGAAERGLQVIIAGAGGAAHLPGMLAAATPLPVIGVPVPLRHLDGLDSLLSIVQMPAGVPVATVAIGAARNAGLLAARILGTADPAVRAAVTRAQEELAETARAKDARVRRTSDPGDPAAGSLTAVAPGRGQRPCAREGGSGSKPLVGSSEVPARAPSHPARPPRSARGARRSMPLRRPPSCPTTRTVADIVRLSHLLSYVTSRRRCRGLPRAQGPRDGDDRLADLARGAVRPAPVTAWAHGREHAPRAHGSPQSRWTIS
jgi:5-(carboxyamino)imidazole ribonucleotide mutase